MIKETQYKMTQAYPFDLVWKVEHEGPVDGDHGEAHQGRPHGAVEHDRKELAIPPTDWRFPCDICMTKHKTNGNLISHHSTPLSS